MKNKNDNNNLQKINIFFSDTGISIIELLESDFNEFLNDFLRENISLV